MEDLPFVLACLGIFITGCIVLCKALWADNFELDFLPEEEGRQKALPVPPAVLQDFGEHRNPLISSTLPMCKEKFVQVNARTWQCPSCKLVRFQRPAEGN